MTTTSLKLPDDIKQLAALAARQQGVTPHAFMVEAIKEAALNAEKRARFVQDAVRSYDEAQASGQGYAMDDVHAYLRTKVRGKKVSKPETITWRR